MIVINIYYRGQGSNAKQFVNEMLASGTVDQIRAEDGNLCYEYFFPAQDGETVLLIDAWRDQKAIDKHHHSPMMQKIIDLREKYNLHMKVERYVLESENLPEKDRDYIRE